MDDDTRILIEKVLGYTLRTDARLMALQMAISESLGHNEEQKEAFQQTTYKNFKILYQIMLEKSEDIDPALAARLLDEMKGDLDD